jgi:hypothetical protein
MRPSPWGADHELPKEGLGGLELLKDQFVDLCIMLGCDALRFPPKGIRPKAAHCSEHKSIETILKNIDARFTVPGDWCPTKAGKHRV